LGVLNCRTQLIMDFELFNKYLRGETTEAEVKELFQWIDTSSDNRKEFIEYKKVWALTAQGNENVSQTWNSTFAPRIRYQKRFKSIMKYSRYAAGFLLLIVSGITLQYFGWGIKNDKLVYEKNMSVTAPWGQMTNVVLPDGSSVTLNSGSSISYNGNFSLGIRTVNLSGEAYFNVTKDSKHPFIVLTSLVNLKVYGTSFNIEAYTGENMVNTTLIEGSLGVLNKENKELVLLIPGQNAYFDANTQKVSDNQSKHRDLYLMERWIDYLQK